MSINNNIIIPEHFWLEDFTELYKNNKYMKIIPNFDMTKVEQMNSFTRLCIYLIIVALVIDYGDIWVYLPIICIVVIVVYHNMNKMDEKNTIKNNDLNIINNKLDSKLNDIDNKLDNDSVISNISNLSNINNASIDTRTNYSDNAWLNSIYKGDDEMSFDKESCKKSTISNPFMNLNITDYNNENENPPEACNVDDEFINEDISVNFSHDLFQNVGELWERRNSQRQFYDMPNRSVPTNQKEFAELLYKTPPTCKENTENCMRYEDLKYKR
jgi:hypothetical protein